jgi:hypothetical protein
MSLMQESPPHARLLIDDEITHSRSWLAPTVALLALVFGLVGGVVLGRASVDEPASESTPTAEVIETLHNRIDAVNGGDADEIAAFYTPSAVLDEQDIIPGRVTTTNTAIGEHLAGYVEMGFQLVQRGDVLVYGRYAVETLGWTNGGGVSIYEFDNELKIVHQWVIGGDPL